MKVYHIKFLLNGYTHYTLIKAQNYNIMLNIFTDVYVVPLGAHLVYAREEEYGKN